MGQSFTKTAEIHGKIAPRAGLTASKTDLCGATPLEIPGA